jgi:uncharacterized protein
MAYGTATPSTEPRCGDTDTEPRCGDTDTAEPDFDAPDVDAGYRRRCVVTGAVADTRTLIRFVVAPDGRLVADVAERLPGRGIWVSATADCLARLLGRRSPAARAARRPVAVPADIQSHTAELLLRRGQDLIALARRAGAAVAGYEKSHAWLLAGKAGLLLAASDGNTDDRARLRRLGDGVPVADAFTASELGLAFGRERTVHAVIRPGSLADSIRREAERLAGCRPRGQDADLTINQGPTELT